MSNPSADQTATPRQVPAPAGVVRQVLANKGFVACAVLLLTLAASFDAIAYFGHIQFKKLPVPLKKSLSLMDQSLLQRPICTLGGEVRGHLYSGRVAPPVVEAFNGNGIKLASGARVEVKESGRRWEVTGSVAGSRAERTYLLESNQATGQVDVSVPYRLIGAAEIKPEILDALGTDQYIQWTLLDESRTGEYRPEDYIQLFVTYYTGSAEQVPHVPEECYMGGGGYHIKGSEGETLMDVPVPGLGPEQTVQVKLLDLEGPALASSGSKIVMYVFNTNGRFCADRNCVRMAMADPYERHAYFSKLEVTFGTRDEFPTKEAAIEAGRRFLAVVIPVLIKDHWPDWDKVIKDERQARTTGKTDGK